jgi:hypothetical protein
VPVVGDWSADFWGSWCRDATGMIDGRIDFMTEVMVGGGWGCGIVAGVVEADNEGCGCVEEVEGWR